MTHHPNRFQQFFLCAFFFVFLLTAAGANGTGFAAGKIIEEVDVTNIKVAVRVFQDGKPVPGLKKDDFILRVNGKEKEINGFYEFNQVLDSPTTEPRLFFLLFNICDYHLDVENVLDPLFERIIKPNDHIILITNNFFQEDRHIPNPKEELEKIKGILRLETGKIGPQLRTLEQRMKSLIRLFRTRSQIDGMEAANTQDFIQGYLQLVEEYKNLFLDLGNDRYIRLAHQLKTQEGEKWVLSFYQVGKFFKPRMGSEFFKTLMESKNNNSQLFGSFNAMQQYEKIRDALEPRDVLVREDLVKLFAGTGATFHTVLMEHGRTMENELAGELSYAPVISDSYNLLKEISQRTGGTFIDANNIDNFYRKVATGYDLHYVITFVPEEADPFKNKINITLKKPDKKYRLVYDTLKRSRFVEKKLKKIREELPQIRVERVDFTASRLSFVVSNFKTTPNDSTGPANPAAIIKLPVRLQVFDKNSQSLFDGVKMFEFTAAQLAGKEARVKLEVDFPEFPAGEYDVFIWVGDPLTGKRNLAVKGITVTAKTD